MSLVNQITRAAELSNRRRFSITHRRRLPPDALVVAATPTGLSVVIGRCDAGGTTSCMTIELSHAEARRVSKEIQRLLK